ncbi:MULTISPECIES: sodium/sugar symporter [Spirosoma]|uniref:Sodium/sugar symporter n=1 Tax=Spirosoma liriopis TaxID=2937440 RepID=A0ABT0HJ26_9BACT|nr:MULTISPECIES: sodium/sugar symporter [Spirosoma]MCK8492147.1 sodium/sugar symporter [Spirosoma liriopis]UHG91568.1 sodium/sugar symporter [Spirosoma oryzicola]
MQKLQALDYTVFFVYFIIVSAYGYWIYKKKHAENISTTDFFLAEGSLTWWAIGSSLIASNISAEQFIGASGDGFAMGLAIATYEWMAAATLIVVAVFFMPIYLKNRIFTMPQFLTQRYNNTVAMIMAIFWLFLYVLVNLTSILFLGALAVSTISGLNFTACMIGLAVFAVIITLGGMKVIGYTDVIQVFFLILGGLATTYLAINLVSTQSGTEGVMNGFNQMLTQSADHFHMIFEKDNPHYSSLPGLTVLIGGMWIVNLNYWGCNQYITQRALGADLKTAREGILFAAFLKLLMPIIVVLPGIAAYTLYQKGLFQQEMLDATGEINKDHAYPVLLNLLPAGLKGLSFAALTAAVVASLAGKANSISTIFTLDIFKKYISPDASEKRLVQVGRITIWVSMVMAILISPFMGIDKKGGFQFIQEMTGLVSPGVFAAFLLGFFWKKTNSQGALFAIVGGFLLSLFFKYVLPDIVNLEFLAPIGFAVQNANGVYTIPFLDTMGLVFLICVAVMIVMGLMKPGSKGLEIDASMFKVAPTFAIGAGVILVLVTILYATFW